MCSETNFKCVNYLVYCFIVFLFSVLLNECIRIVQMKLIHVPAREYVQMISVLYYKVPILPQALKGEHFSYLRTRTLSRFLYMRIWQLSCVRIFTSIQTGLLCIGFSAFFRKFTVNRASVGHNSLNCCRVE
jgi:hypothetical protein